MLMSLMRYSGTCAAFKMRFQTDRSSFWRRTMFRIRRRIPPRFSGPRPARFRRSSSRIWTSRTQCSLFSIAQWARIYQHDTLDSAFRPMAACCRVAESSAEPDNPRIRGRSAGFQESNRQPLLGILRFRVAWTIFVPQMQRNRTTRAHGMITESSVGN